VRLAPADNDRYDARRMAQVAATRMRCSDEATNPENADGNPSAKDQRDVA